jgi:FkbM family methyltransferase
VTIKGNLYEMLTNLRTGLKRALTGALSRYPEFVGLLYFNQGSGVFAAVKHVCIELPAASALGKQRELLHLRFDNTILREVLTRNSWQKDEIDFVRRHVSPQKSYAIVDVGANVGLFSLQCLNQFGDRITACYCFEPSADNFACLKFNLRNFADKLSAHNAGLGATNESLKIFKDVANAGNYSLRNEAMKSGAFWTELVEILSTARFFEQERSTLSSQSLIWKSDTQGYDQLIVSLVPFDIWEAVDVAILELSSANAADHDRSELARRIGVFPNKLMNFHDGRPARSVTLEEIQIFGQQRQHHDADLYLWK